MRPIVSAIEGGAGNARGSRTTRIKNGFRNGARGIRSAATFLPARLRGFFAGLGPGLTTGAADDDPSGISTYSVTGASFGYAPLWTALFSFPLMVSVQLMCARLGMVTGRGLAGVVRRRYSRGVLWMACALLVVANIFNIGADLGGMAEATEMVTGLDARLLVPLYALLVVSLLFWSSYRRIARTFKWLTLVLFAYVGAGILARPDWHAILRATFVPHIEPTPQYLAIFVGILGTTISPYLFFWQAGQEVEEERARGRLTIGDREGTTDAEIRRSNVDVTVGMFFSNVVMYFIILTTAATLHAHGLTEITTAREAAAALRPLAGNAAYWLFTLGIIGTGILSVPILAGSCAYAIAEAAAWRGSLDARPKDARAFYAVVAVAMAVGLLLDFLGFNAVAMLFWCAVVNGVLAPPLIVLIVLLTSDPAVMGPARTNPTWLRALGWTTAVVMGGAAVAMLVTAVG
jgi:NRAMP (natural resistance-associated macrophage protein)-like metal ion transporter